MKKAPGAKAAKRYVQKVTVFRRVKSWTDIKTERFFWVLWRSWSFLKGARQPPVRPPSSRRTLWCRAEQTARRSKNHTKFTFPLWENCFRFRNYCFDVEVEHFLHVGRNWRQNGVTTPVIACVCYDDRPNRRRDSNWFPRNRKFLKRKTGKILVRCFYFFLSFCWTFL